MHGRTGSPPLGRRGTTEHHPPLRSRGSADDVPAHGAGHDRRDTAYPETVIDDIKKRALHRTHILAGQLRGLEKMIENEDYCVDILTQSLAIQKSLGSLNKLLVENHLRTHVAEQFEAGGDDRERAVEELLKVFELSNNRG
jgi:DNA-binding FrmR family transcriptional regulator